MANLAGAQMALELDPQSMAMQANLVIARN